MENTENTKNAYQIDKETRKEIRILQESISNRMELIRFQDELNQQEINKVVELKSNVLKAFVELSKYKPEVKPKKNIHIAINECKNQSSLKEVRKMIDWLEMTHSDSKNTFPENPLHFKINGNVIMNKNMKMQDKAIFLKYFYIMYDLFYIEHSIKTFMYKLSAFISEIKVEHIATVKLVKNSEMDDLSISSLKKLRDSLSKMMNLGILTSTYWIETLKK